MKEIWESVIISPLPSSSATEEAMNNENLEGYWDVVQSNTTFDNPLASVREELTKAFNHFQANITFRQC